LVVDRGDGRVRSVLADGVALLFPEDGVLEAMLFPVKSAC
jgi:hypothetical protein